MILLGTMAVVELLKPSPDAAFAAWAAQAPRAEMCIASVTEGELLFGAEELPEGRRKREYRRRLDRFLGEVLEGRVFPYERTAAAFFAEFAVMRRKAGRTTKRTDAMTAATARARGARLIATRDFGHFEGCGVSLMNPWDTSGRVPPALRVLPGGDET